MPAYTHFKLRPFVVHTVEPCTCNLRVLLYIYDIMVALGEHPLCASQP